MAHHRISRISALFLGSVWILAGCLAQGPSSTGGPMGGAGNGAAGAGSSEIAAADGSAAAAEDTAAEPKPFPSGIASGTTDWEDPDPEAIARSSIHGTFTKVCTTDDYSRYRVDAMITTHWVGSNTDSCLPLGSLNLVSVVTVGGEEHWTMHSVDEECRFSDVFTAPAFGPRKFYLVKCEGFVCKPKAGDLPIPSAELKAPLVGQVPPPCWQFH